jgi:hypothetical protein
MGANGTNGDTQRREDGLLKQLFVPIGVLAIKNISLTEKIVLACLMQNSDRETGVSPARINYTSNYLSLTPKEVSDAFFELEKKGLVSREIEGFVFYDHPSYHMRLKREREE